MFLNWLRKILCSPLLEKLKSERDYYLKLWLDLKSKAIVLPSPPRYTKELSFNDVYSLTKKFTSNIYLSDLKYKTFPISELKRFLRTDWTDKKKWVREVHDCDEFSFQLMGLINKWAGACAFGIAWSPVHAYNIWIDDKKQLWIIEPQTDILYKPTEVNSPYLPFRLVII